MELNSLADLHIHTTYSDGTATVPDVLAHVAASNLHVIAITDHDAIAGALEARQLARDFGVEVIVGEEVSTLDGHVLALFIAEFLPPGRPAAETIAGVHAQGGLCVAPHSYDWAVISLGRNGDFFTVPNPTQVQVVKSVPGSASIPATTQIRILQRWAGSLIHAVWRGKRPGCPGQSQGAPLRDQYLRPPLYKPAVNNRLSPWHRYCHLNSPL